MSEQKLNVNDLARDKAALEAKVTERIGKTVKLEENEAVITDLESVTSHVTPAILLRERGRGGAVCIHAQSAKLVETVQTGPQLPENSWIIFLEDGQNCRFYGQPSVWYFKLCP